MREIKFRGRDEHGEWHFGDLLSWPIIRSFNGWNYEYKEVAADTVGQYIGRKDKKHREIYEGDLVKDSNNYVYRVVYNEYLASFGLRRKQDAYMHYFGDAFESEACEIIGNIYDNPSLMEGTR